MINLWRTVPSDFGREVSWQDEEVVSAPHKMSFNEALRIMSSDVFFKLVLPDRALEFNQRTRNVKIAYQELQVCLHVLNFLVTQSEGLFQSYMMEMIVERQTSEKVERYDLLSSLLEANTNNLTDAELMGTSNPDYELFRN